MAKFVRDDVRFGEVAGSAEAAAQFVEEPEIEIHIMIGGTVKRTADRLSESARRLNRFSKQTNFRRLIPVTEQVSPRHLRVLHHRVDKVDELFFLGSARHGPGRANCFHGRSATAAAAEK